MISFGTRWWEARDPNQSLREPCWFNSTGFKTGGRIRNCLAIPGQIRFNTTSGFHPEFRTRVTGRTFRCDPPRLYQGRIHLLVKAPAPRAEPEFYLVTLCDVTHGQISFQEAGWRSPMVQPVSLSQRQDHYEATLLMDKGGWIRSELGFWRVDDEGVRLLLGDDRGHEAV